MPATLTYTDSPEALQSSKSLVVIGRVAQLLSDEVRGVLPADLDATVWTRMVRSGDPGDSGRRRDTARRPRRPAPARPRTGASAAHHPALGADG